MVCKSIERLLSILYGIGDRTCIAGVVEKDPKEKLSGPGMQKAIEQTFGDPTFLLNFGYLNLKSFIN